MVPRLSLVRPVCLCTCTSYSSCSFASSFCFPSPQSSPKALSPTISTSFTNLILSFRRQSMFSIPGNHGFATCSHRGNHKTCLDSHAAGLAFLSCTADIRAAINAFSHYSILDLTDCRIWGLVDCQSLCQALQVDPADHPYLVQELCQKLHVITGRRNKLNVR